MNRKVVIKKSKRGAGYTFNVTLDGLTKGEIMSMQHALEASGSPVASDVLAYLNNGIRECQEDWLKDLVES